MNHPYIDLHTHTCLSDGNLTPVELLREAREAGIGILAITDHNSTEDLTAWRAAFPELTLIQGAEITCRYLQHELHVVALGIDPEDPMKIELILEEMGTSIFTHAYKSNDNKYLNIRILYKNTEEVVIYFQDNGVPFDIEGDYWNKKDFSEIKIIKNFSKDIDYNYNLRLNNNKIIIPKN